MENANGETNAPSAAGVRFLAVVKRYLHPVASSVVATPRDTLHEACASEEFRTTLNVQVGDWISVSRPVRDSKVAQEPWLVRLVEAGDDAVVCSVVTSSKVSSLPSLYLSTPLIEGLGVTPGRSTVEVAALGPGDSQPPLASRVVVARIRAPNMHRRCNGALLSFFRVPRTLRRGEVFSVPVPRVPRRLREIEEGSRVACGADLEALAQDESSDDVAGERDGQDFADESLPGSAAESFANERDDPLHGLSFCETISFRVLTIEAASSDDGRRKSLDGCCRVDSKHAELLVQGTDNARGLPYVANHLFCIQPRPLLMSLQLPFDRLLGLFAPHIRTWLRLPADESEQATPPVAIVSGARGCGKRTLFRSVCDRLGLHFLEVNCYNLAAQNPNGVDEALQQLVIRASQNSPSVLCLRRLQALCQGGPSLSPAALQLTQQRLSLALTTALRQANVGHNPRQLLFLVASCEILDDLSGPIRRAFQVEVSLPRPNEEARAAAFEQLLSRHHIKQGQPSSIMQKAMGDSTQDLSAGAMAKLTAGLSYSDLRSVCSELAMNRWSDAAVTSTEVVERAVKRLSGGSKVAITLSAKTGWNDIGGLQEAKDEIMDCITLPLSQGHLFGGQKLRSGILLFGPPGTGKTLLAKAVATECRVHFLSVKGPELLSMYIGESEKNVRNIFERARELAPCVLFFDELDSLAPARGRGSDSGGVMDRVVSQLLTELDTMPTTVFLVGATNRPDLLDRSLLRPGRLDRMVYLGIAAEKLPLLRAIARKFDLDEPTSDGVSADNSLLLSVSKACPSNLTGADVAALCADAYALSLKEHTDLLDDIAVRTLVSVTTLLFFFEELSRDYSDSIPSPAAGDTTLTLIFPKPIVGESCSQDGFPGITLYGCCQAGAYILKNRSMAASVTTVIGFDARPIVDCQSDSPGPRSGPNVSVDPSQCSRWASEVGAAECAAVCNLCPFNALRVRVAWRHFQEALRTLQPSVPFEDLERYEQLAKEHSNTK